MIGSAAFLFPDGRIVPASFVPPSTRYCSAPMAAKTDGRMMQRQAHEKRGVAAHELVEEC